MESLYRQDFQTGVRLYETKEYSLARDSFYRALGSTPTNYFAHQYLGFIAVHEDLPADATNHFEAAYKYAKTDTHRALALSHLARCHYARGKPAEAAEPARKAADIDDSAAFWYEYAIYSALGGDMKPVLPAIVNAMQNDWVYWAIAVAEPLLDPIRGDISKMMTDLRERIARKSRKVLDQMRDLVEGLQKLGGMDTAPIQKELAGLERRFAENNIYQLRNLTTEAEEMVRKVTKTAHEAVTNKISARKRVLRKNDVWRENQVGHLSSPVRQLRHQQDHLNATFKVWNA
jgi:tetratricopeptide (TPR) repeat protein